jgi:Fungal trichothecene efflux pump (TRI12)
VLTPPPGTINDGLTNVSRISSLFESDPLILAAYEQTFWAGTGVSTLFWGYMSTRFRRLREPIFAGFLIFLAGMVGIATIGPGQSTNSIIFSTMAGIGWGSPLILVIAAVQLATPHHIFITATAVTAASRALAGTIFTAILSSVLNNSLASKLGPYITKVGLKAGLPQSSITAFVAAVEAKNATLLATVPGATQDIFNAGLYAQKKAYAESLRTVFIITLPFGLIACIACFFMADLRKEMNYIVDAPLEHLHAKHPEGHENQNKEA